MEPQLVQPGRWRRRAVRPDVLILDDDPDLRLELSALLSAMGLRVEAFGDARAVLQAAPDLDYRLAFVDIFMPECDGIELMRSLRRHAVGFPIVLMSGGGVFDWPEDYLRRLTLLGAEGFLKKPFREAEVTALVRRLLDPG